MPSMVVVAPGDPGSPVVYTWARAECATAMTAAASIPPRRIWGVDFIGIIRFLVTHLTHLSERNLLCLRRFPYRTLGLCDAPFRRSQGEAKSAQQVAASQFIVTWLLLSLSQLLQIFWERVTR